MSSVGSSTSKISNDNSLYGISPPEARFQSALAAEADDLYLESPPQVRFQSVFTPEEGARIIKGPTKSRAQEGFYSENDHRSLKERRDAWLFGDSKVQACIDKSDIIK
ncbi:MAG TPA: hypothetical protein VIJ46_02985 [Rhabdochlamydiaceae bacterium]